MVVGRVALCKNESSFILRWAAGVVNRWDGVRGGGEKIQIKNAKSIKLSVVRLFSSTKNGYLIEITDKKLILLNISVILVDVEAIPGSNYG